MMIILDHSAQQRQKLCNLRGLKTTDIQYIKALSMESHDLLPQIENYNVLLIRIFLFIYFFDRSAHWLSKHKSNRCICDNSLYTMKKNTLLVDGQNNS